MHLSKNSVENAFSGKTAKIISKKENLLKWKTDWKYWWAKHYWYVLAVPQILLTGGL